MRRAWLVIAVVAGCKAGNFLTVDVIGIPCDASSLHVTVELGNGAVSEYSFTDSVRIGDGETSFAIDLGAHKTGVLVVTVEAITSTGQFSESTTASLPEGSVKIDLAQGGSCGTSSGSDAGPGSGPGMIDAGVLPDADPSCSWNFDPTNYAPCAPGFPAASAAFEVTGLETLDTDHDAGMFNSVVYNFNNTGEVLLIHATSFVVSAPGGKLTVHGTRPLLIVVDGNAMIDGTIDFSAAARPTTGCSISPAMPGLMSAPGGAGGGFAIQGGGGGDNGGDPSVPGPPGGGATGNSVLTPLRPGCPGGDGGTAGAVQGGVGGAAGGALEISSNVTLAITGKIFAGGGGGDPGTASGMKDASGGGGGGTGGAVLLEAITISFASAASVCAAGGGGGEGADMLVGSMAGVTGTCTPGAGGSISQGGDGGTGGGASNPRAGAPGAGPGHGDERRWWRRLERANPHPREADRHADHRAAGEQLSATAQHRRQIAPARPNRETATATRNAVIAAIAPSRISSTWIAIARPPAYTANAGTPFASIGTSRNAPAPAGANTMASIDAPIAVAPAIHSRIGGIASIASSRSSATSAHDVGALPRHRRSARAPRRCRGSGAGGCSDAPPAPRAHAAARC